MTTQTVTLVIISSLSIPLAFAQTAFHYKKDIGHPTDGVLRKVQHENMQEAYFDTLQASSHAANLLALRNGDVLCFWFTGTWEGESGVGIAVSRLSPGSRKWTKPQLIDHKEGESYQNPVPFQAPDGTIWLLHTTQLAGRGQADARVLVVKSHDDGRSWSAPELLFDQPGSFIRNPLVFMPDGSWMLPMYYTPSKGITTGAESNYSVVKISHDQGRTWTDCPIPQSNGYVQPSVIRLPDNHYIAFFRSRFADWIFKSTSTDGCHWTAPTKTTLPNNNASIQAALLSDQSIVLAFNDCQAAAHDGKPREGPRKPLSVALSKDYGETWRWIRDVETRRQLKSQVPINKDGPGREEYSYPSVLQDPDGSIDVAFTFRRETIKFIRFSKSWIESAELHGRGPTLSKPFSDKAKR
jgi:predicted neuraminidase